jgi:hypothetical protein
MRLICAALASVVLVTGCGGPSPRVAFVQDGEGWRQISLAEARSLKRQEQAAALQNEPVPTDLSPTDPIPTDPASADPASADPVSADPVSADPASKDPMSAIEPPAVMAEAAAPAQHTALAELSSQGSAADTDKTSVSIAKDVCNIPGGQSPTPTPPCTL